MTVASLPIFWPFLEAGFGSIVITQEVHVTAHRRLGDDNSSTRSSKGSEIELNRTQSGGVPDYYRDPYIVETFDPMLQKSNHTTEVVATAGHHDRNPSV